MANTIPKYVLVTLDEDPQLVITLKDIDIDSGVLVSIAGVLNSETSNFFRKQLTRIIDAGALHFVLDVSATTIFSGTGVGAFTPLLKFVRENETGSVSLFGLPDGASQIFQLMGFSVYFQFSNSLQEALDKMKK